MPDLSKDLSPLPHIAADMVITVTPKRAIVEAARRFADRGDAARSTWCRRPGIRVASIALMHATSFTSADRAAPPALAINVPPDPPAPRLPDDWPRPPPLPEEPPYDPSKPPKHDPPPAPEPQIEPEIPGEEPPPIEEPDAPPRIDAAAC